MSTAVCIPVPNELNDEREVKGERSNLLRHILYTFNSRPSFLSFFSPPCLVIGQSRAATGRLNGSGRQ